MSAKESATMQALKRLDAVRWEIQKYLPDDFHSERELEKVRTERYGKESAFSIFMDKMNAAEKSVQDHSCYSEEEVEKELDKI